MASMVVNKFVSHNKNRNRERETGKEKIQDNPRYRTRELRRLWYGVKRSDYMRG